MSEEQYRFNFELILERPSEAGSKREAGMNQEGKESEIKSSKVASLKSQRDRREEPRGREGGISL